MNIGDLVQRKICPADGGILKSEAAIHSRKVMGMGIVMSKQISGDPPHPCVNVLYPRIGKSYMIAESLLEVVCGTG